MNISTLDFFSAADKGRSLGQADPSGDEYASDAMFLRMPFSSLPAAEAHPTSIGSSCATTSPQGHSADKNHPMSRPRTIRFVLPTKPSPAGENSGGESHDARPPPTDKPRSSCDGTSSQTLPCLVEMWQSDKDLRFRRKMIRKIAMTLKRNIRDSPGKDLRKLQRVAKRLEEALYRAAPSFEAYADISTLKYRLKLLAARISRKHQDTNRKEKTSSRLNG